MPSGKPKPNRQRGWLGTRIEVCGYQLATAPHDIICHLPPNHYPQHIHASIAQSINTPNDTNPIVEVVVVIQDNEKETLKWLDVQPP
jgi:hypothetical protein